MCSCAVSVGQTIQPGMKRVAHAQDVKGRCEISDDQQRTVEKGQCSV
jgi:hypothetical protein